MKSLIYLVVFYTLSLSSKHAFSCEETFDENESENIKRYKNNVNSNMELIKSLMGEADSHTSVGEVLTSLEPIDQRDVETKKNVVKFVSKIIETHFQITPHLRKQSELLQSVKINYFIDVLNESPEASKVSHQAYEKEYDAITSRRGKDLEEYASRFAENINAVIREIQSKPLIEHQIEILIHNPVMKMHINSLIVPNYMKIITDYLEKTVDDIHGYLSNRDYLISLALAFMTHYGLFYDSKYVSLLKKLENLFRSKTYTSLLHQLSKFPLESYSPLFLAEEMQFSFFGFFAIFPNQHEVLDKIILNPKNKLLKYRPTWNYIKNLYKEPENFENIKRMYQFASQKIYPSTEENLLVNSVIETLTFDSKMIRRIRDYSLDHPNLTNQERSYFWNMSLEKSRTPNPYGIEEGTRSRIDEIKSKSITYFLNHPELFNYLTTEERFRYLKIFKIYESSPEKFLSWLSQDTKGFVDFVFEHKEELSSTDLALVEKLGRSQNKDHKLLFLTLILGSKSFNINHIGYISNLTERQLEDPLLKEIFKDPRFFRNILQTSSDALHNQSLSLDNTKSLVHDLLILFNNHRKNIGTEELIKSEKALLKSLIEFASQSMSSPEKLLAIFEVIKRSIDTHSLWKHFPSLSTSTNPTLEEKIFVLLIYSSEASSQFGMRTPQTKSILSKLILENEPTLSPLLTRFQESSSRIRVNLESDADIKHDEVSSNYSSKQRRPPKTSDAQTDNQDAHFSILERLFQHPEIVELESLISYLHPSKIKYAELKKLLDNKHLKSILSDPGFNYSNFPNICEFLINIDSKSIDSLILETKSLFSQIAMLNLELSSQKSKSHIANTTRIHQDLFKLEKLLSHSNPEISSHAFRTMKSILASWEFHSPEIFMEYFTNLFLDTMAHEYSKKSLEFILNWLAAQHDSKNFVSLVERLAYFQRENFEKAQIDEIMLHITNTNHFVLKASQKKNPSPDEIQLALVASYLLYQSHGWIDKNILSLLDLSTQQEAISPVVVELKKLNLKALTKPSIVSARFAKNRVYFEENTITSQDLEDSISHFATTALFLREEQKQKNLMVGKFDVQNSMEEASIYAAVLEELNEGRLVWIVDNQHNFGFDVLSFDASQNQFFTIEVKSKLSEASQLIVSHNELKNADRYSKSKLAKPYIYLVDIQNSNIQYRRYFQITKYYNIDSTITSDENVTLDGKNYVIPRNILNQYFSIDP